MLRHRLKVCLALTLCLFMPGNAGSMLLLERVDADNPTPVYLTMLDASSRQNKLRKHYDPEIDQQAVKFNGLVGIVGQSGLKGTLAAMDSPQANGQPELQWVMNANPGYRFNVYLDTTNGPRLLTYRDAQGPATPVTPGSIEYRLKGSKNRWVKVARNLSEDLQKVEPGNSINSIRYATLNGSGEIQGLKIKHRPSDQKSKALAATEPTLDAPELSAAMSPTRRALNLRSARGRLALTIDGITNEQVWFTAPVADSFDTRAGRLATGSRTEVRALSDSTHLYFAFRCYDDQPDLVSAVKTLRDGGLGIDDAVSVVIDTYRQFDTAATYSVNALGTQNNVVSGGSVDKVQWKGDWQGAAARTDYGWSAEIAIPFKTLRFDSNASTFGVNFLRYHNRTAQSSHWVKPATSRNRDPQGLLTGFRLPGYDAVSAWTLMPYVIAGKNVNDIDGVRQESDLRGGLALRYRPTSNLTGLLELLPDFSQIESQISDIDFSYNEKEQADTRPFFQEGAAYFGSDTKYFYSRRIPDFQTGVKTFLQSDRNTLGALIVRSDEGRTDSHLRYRRNTTANSGFELSAVSFDNDEQQGRLLSIGVDGRLESGLFFDLNTATNNFDSDTDSLDGNTAGLLLGWGKDDWELGIKSDRYDIGFQPATGLLNNDLPGTRSTELYASYYHAGKGNIKQINFDASLLSRKTLDGQDQNNGTYLATDFELYGKSRLQLAYSQFEYRPVTDQPGQFSDTVNDDYYWSVSTDFNIYSSRFGYGAFLADGVLGGGDYRYVSGYAWYSPTSNTNLKLSTESLSSFGEFNQSTLTGGWDITATDGIVARVVNGDDYRQTRLAYRRRVKTGADVFVAIQKENDSDTELAGKLVWTF